MRDDECIEKMWAKKTEHIMSQNFRNPKPPRCPRCAQFMTLVRTTERFGGLPMLRTFECHPCDMCFAYEAEQKLAA